MSLEPTVLKSVLQYITGEVDDVCRLCLMRIQNKKVLLEDFIKIDKPYLSSVLTYEEIFNELNVVLDSHLPTSFCHNCASAITNAYLFKRLTEYSYQKWNQVLVKIDSILSLTDTINESVKTAYLIVNHNENIMLSSRSHTSKKNAVNKMRNIIKYREKYANKKNKVTQIICEECGEKFKSSNQLSSHHSRAHSKTRYPCPQCPKILLTHNQLEYHLERIHYPKKIKCQKCDKMFSSKKLLNYHYKSYHTAVICKLCFVQLSSKKALRAHMNKHDVNNCSRCNKSFVNKQTYNLHIKLCGNVESKRHKFFCDICGKGYVQKAGLRSHIMVDHGFSVNVLSCKWCNKKFDAVSKLRNHSVKHTRERNFHCEQCGNKFVTQAALVYHTRLHTGEKPYACDLCDEKFLSSSRRMEHKHRKHFGPSKECSICHCKFVSGHRLKKHYQRHFNPQSKLYVPDTKDSLSLKIKY